MFTIEAQNRKNKNDEVEMTGLKKKIRPFVIYIISRKQRSRLFDKTLETEVGKKIQRDHMLRS